jgi:hypothetical protein
LPIPDSKDKKFYLQVSASDVEFGQSLEIFMTSQDRLWLGELDINGSKTEYNFSLITYHHVSNPLVIFFGIVSDLIKRLFTDLPFVAFYLALISALSGYMFFLKKVTNEVTNVE